MNSAILLGRLVRDVNVSYTQGEKSMCIARYTLAVDRRFKRDGEQTADFINCVAFGKNGEFAEKYLHKGIKIAVMGHIQTGSYTNKDGNKVYTTDVIVDSQEFVESKAASESANASADPRPQAQAPQSRKQYTAPAPAQDDFMSIPDGVDEELPFS